MQKTSKLMQLVYSASSGRSMEVKPGGRNFMHLQITWLMFRSNADHLVNVSEQHMQIYATNMQI